MNATTLLDLFRTALHPHHNHRVCFLDLLVQNNNYLKEEVAIELLSMDAKLRDLIKKVKKEHDDDAIDRIIYATTVYILSFFAILIMAKQYVGEPLQCWVEFSAIILIKTL